MRDWTKDLFHEAWEAIGIEPRRGAYDEVMKRYAEPHRKYRDAARR